MSGYSLSPQAVEDLFEIWQYIAQDSEDAANRVQSEFFETFVALARTPGQGHDRKNLTTKPVLFFALYSYLIVYQADVNPIRILALVHGRRNVKRVLKQRRL
jgi:antitoxin ParD1/3/4